MDGTASAAFLIGPCSRRGVWQSASRRCGGVDGALRGRRRLAVSRSGEALTLYVAPGVPRTTASRF